LRAVDFSPAAAHDGEWWNSRSTIIDIAAMGKVGRLSPWGRL